MNARTLRPVFRRLLDHYGPQGWWPAETPFEVMVGAVLTQNTAWSNVERALAGLQAGGALDPERILALPSPDLAETIRPSGYFRVKAERLRSLCRWYLERGGMATLETRDTETIRADLLAVRGIGPETADDILLYALDRPVTPTPGACSRASDGSRAMRTTRHCGRGLNASWARTSRSIRSTTPSSCITPRRSAAPGPIASVAASHGAALGPPLIDTGWPRVERRGEMLSYELQDVKKL